MQGALKILLERLIAAGEVASAYGGAQNIDDPDGDVLSEFVEFIDEFYPDNSLNDLELCLLHAAVFAIDSLIAAQKFCVPIEPAIQDIFDDPDGDVLSEFVEFIDEFYPDNRVDWLEAFYQVVGQKPLCVSRMST